MTPDVYKCTLNSLDTFDTRIENQVSTATKHMEQFSKMSRIWTNEQDLSSEDQNADLDTAKLWGIFGEVLDGSYLRSEMEDIFKDLEDFYKPRLQAALDVFEDISNDPQFHDIQDAIRDMMTNVENIRQGLKEKLEKRPRFEEEGIDLDDVERCTVEALEFTKGVDNVFKLLREFFAKPVDG